MRVHLAAMLLCGCGPSMPGGPPTLLHDAGSIPDMGAAAPDLASVYDPNVDHDGDGWTIAKGDCNDNDPTTYPGAPELCDGHDHDCDGISDGTCDDDRDGYAIIPNPKNGVPGGDCNDHDPLVNLGAMEVPGDGVDNNCDGLTDEPPVPCTAPAGSANATDLAAALDLCGRFLTAAQVNNDADPHGRKVAKTYGLYMPKAGANFAVFSTGNAAAENEPGYADPQPGTAFHNNDANPLPMTNKTMCFNGSDEPMVHDYHELKLTLKVPTNAKSFSFNFVFMTAEYPEYVCSQFNDKFLVILDSKSYKGNISFDSKGQPVTVNVGFFSGCSSSSHNCDGTGYELSDTNGIPIGGTTGWLKTSSPLTPGETATLRFVLFDESDHFFDSAVLIDNFQFQLQAATVPMTVG